MYRSRCCHTPVVGTACSLPAFGQAHGAIKPYHGVILRPGRPAGCGLGSLVWGTRHGSAAALPPTGRLGRRLHCSARLTSSRDSLDEDLAEARRQQLPETGGSPALVTRAAQQRPTQQEQQAPPTASAGTSQNPAAPLAAASVPADAAVAPRQLSVRELQRLTQLHAEDAYRCGVVSSPADLAACLGTDLAQGLCESQDALEVRAERYGRNTVPPPREATFLELVGEALQDFTVLVLLAAGGLSLGLEAAVHSGGSGGEPSWIEGASILAAVSLVVLVTAGNNYQKERQFRVLQAAAADVQVRAVRGGRELAVPVSEVLVGDLLLLEAGDILCADGLLVSGSDVKVDESHLTGEADDVSKDPAAAPSLLGGSRVLSGAGRMLVTAVGRRSQSGAIAEMVARGSGGPAAAPAAALEAGGGAGGGLREETLLQRKLAEYAATIGRFGLGAAALATAAMAARFSVETFFLAGQPWDWAYLQDYLRFFITGVTILVVAVPEGLPLAVTIALAFSVRRMLADNNLVRHLSAAETMGTATVVCSDKTGTLTQNDMVVSRLWLAGQLVPDVKRHMRRQQRPGAGTQQLRLPAADALPSGSGPPAARSGGGGSTDALPTLSELLALPAAGAAPAGADGGTGDGAAAGPRAGGEPCQDPLQLLVESAALNSTASIILEPDGTTSRVGNRTETALLELAAALGGQPERLRSARRQLARVAFSSERKRMTTAALAPGGSPDCNGSPAVCRIYTKGAPEIVLERCSHVLGPDGRRQPLPDEQKCQLLAGFAHGGQRVLCLAYRDVGLPAEAAFRPGGDHSEPSGGSGSEESDGGGMAASGLSTWLADSPTQLNAWLSGGSSDDEAGRDSGASLADCLESELTLLALVGIEDPLRAEAPAAIRQCQASGITVKMLTGDNVDTATAIARECGILPPLAAAAPAAAGQGAVVAADGWTAGGGALPEGAVMEGREFRQRVLRPDGSLDAAAFLELWPRLRVLARCTPADKYTIVTGVRSLTDDVVAVTGDGTNDAPALRAANVGFAMAAGTATAREAADIVLLDNNFASIASAVLWGRNVYANITRFLQFQLTINLVAVATAVTGAVVAAESPLTAVQMLWVNMIMDSLASLALATEPPDARLLAIPPFSREHEFVDPRTPTVKHIAGQAAYQLAVMYTLVFHAPALLGIPDHSAVAGPSEHYTLVFNAFVFMQLFNQLNSRKILDSTHVWEGLGQARWFQGILGCELLLQVLIIQYGGEWFNTHPLDVREWAVCVGLGAASLLLREVLIRIPYGRYPNFDA